MTFLKFLVTEPRLALRAFPGLYIHRPLRHAYWNIYRPLRSRFVGNDALTWAKERWTQEQNVLSDKYDQPMNTWGVRKP